MLMDGDAGGEEGIFSFAIFEDQTQKLAQAEGKIDSRDSPTAFFLSRDRGTFPQLSILQAKDSHPIWY